MPIKDIEYLFKRIWIFDKLNSKESNLILNTIIKNYQYYRFYTKNY